MATSKGLSGNSTDHLTALPPELQHVIFSFLFPNHEPDRVSLEDANPAPHKNNRHSLDFLAATCHALRSEVRAWALHFLIQHQDVTHYKPLKTKMLQERKDFLRGQGGLLFWAERYCVFCGVKSARSAILMNGLHCCKSCDKKEWPNKITKTKAKSDFNLQDHHLGLDRSSVRTSMVEKYVNGRVKARYGTYIGRRGATTLLQMSDVERVAKMVHGNQSLRAPPQAYQRNTELKDLQTTKYGAATGWWSKRGL